MNMMMEELAEQLPSDWQVVTLGSIMSEVDQRYKQVGAESGEFPVLSLTKRFGLILQSERFDKRVATDDVSKYKVVRRGQVAYNPYVIWEGAVHSLKRFEQGLVSPAYLVWECDTEKSDEIFVDVFLRTPFAVEQYNLYSAGAVNRRRTIRKEDFRRIEIPLPPLSEQHRIAYVLATVQAAIEQQLRLIALTRELKSALMRKLFTEGLRGEKQRETEIGLVPDSWKVVKIGSLGRCVTGTTPKTAVEEYYSPAEYDFIAPADLGRTRDIYDSEKRISEKGLSIIRSLPKNAVMCVCIGSSIGKVGMTWKEQSATNQQINSIICSEKHNARFTYYLLDYFHDYWRGFATFGPVPILNKSRFEGIDIPVPSTIEEENEISELLVGLDSKFEIHDKKQMLLNQLFHTLLYQLMTGQTRISETDLPSLS